jgi:SAM-dependent methyltransferase
MAKPYAPSEWVRRFVPLIRRDGRVLDLAAGDGRHTKLLLDCGFSVTAVDRDITPLQPFAGERCVVLGVDLEGAPPREILTLLGEPFAGIVATRYLYRPLLAELPAALAPDGVLIYETFALGNERFGRPRDPAFLLRPGELLAVCAALTIVAFEHGETTQPKPAVIQRITAVNGPIGDLPQIDAR